MKLILQIILLILFISPKTIFGQPNLPADVNQSFYSLNLSTKYQLSAFLKPAYLQADFNKDGIKDIAILIIEKTTKKRGIILIHGGSNSYYIFGAGSNFGNGGDNFDWLKGWSLYKEKVAYETTFTKEGDILGSRKIKLIRPAFFIHDLQDGAPTAGGIIYWTGKKYLWIHQGE